LDLHLYCLRVAEEPAVFPPKVLEAQPLSRARVPPPRGEDQLAEVRAALCAEITVNALKRLVRDAGEPKHPRREEFKQTDHVAFGITIRQLVLVKGVVEFDQLEVRVSEALEHLDNSGGRKYIKGRVVGKVELLNAGASTLACEVIDEVSIE